MRFVQISSDCCFPHERYAFTYLPPYPVQFPFPKCTADFFILLNMDRRFRFTRSLRHLCVSVSSVAFGGLPHSSRGQHFSGLCAPIGSAATSTSTSYPNCNFNPRQMAETALKLVSRLGLAAAALGLINETCLYDGELRDAADVLGDLGR